MKSHDVKWVPFGEVVERSQYGINAKSVAGAAIPMLRMGNIQDGRLDLTNLVYVDLAESEQKQLLLKPGDFLFNRTNSKDLVGKSALVESEIVATFASYIVRFNFKLELVDPRFILAWFNSTYGLTQVRALASPGVSQYNINPTVLQTSLEVPILPLEEQKKIAEILSTWDRAIDTTLKLAQASNGKLSLELKRLFSSIQSNYKMETIESLCDVKSGGTPSRSKPHYYSGTIPWLKSGEVRQGEIETTEETISDEGLKNSAAKIIPTNTTVVAMYGATAGQVGIIRKSMALNQAVAAIIPLTTSGLDSNYIYAVLQFKAQELLRKCQGSGQPNLNAGAIKSLRIPVMPSKAQDALASYLLALQREEKSLLEFKQLLIKQKQGLMQKLLTGQVRVKV